MYVAKSKAQTQLEKFQTKFVKTPYYNKHNKKGVKPVLKKADIIKKCGFDLQKGAEFCADTLRNTNGSSYKDIIKSSFVDYDNDQNS